MIIHAARLSQKQLSERYVSIRWHLQRYMRQPQPTGTMMAEMERLYELISATWEARPDLRGGRSNIVNLNLILAQFMLRVGGQLFYDAHYPDFPQITTRRNWLKLFRILQRLYRVNGLRAHCPIYKVKKND